MNIKRRQNLLAATLVGALAFTSAYAEDFSPQELRSRTVARRAVDAVIWGVPVVTLDMMRQAYLRDGKAKYNDIIWWPKGSDWMNQSLDADTSVRYMYFFCNTKSDGPVVVEIPNGVAESHFYGTLMTPGRCRSWTWAS